MNDQPRHVLHITREDGEITKVDSEFHLGDVTVLLNGRPVAAKAVVISAPADSAFAAIMRHTAPRKKRVTWRDRLDLP